MLSWAGHVACRERLEVNKQFLVGRCEGKNHVGDPDLDGRYYQCLS
jgi:hypothetical protein